MFTCKVRMFNKFRQKLKNAYKLQKFFIWYKLQHNKTYPAYLRLHKNESLYSMRNCLTTLFTHDPLLFRRRE